MLKKVSFDQFRSYLKYLKYEEDCEPDGGEVWVNAEGHFVSFFCDENMLISDFLLKRLLERINKKGEDFDLFLSSDAAKR